MAELTKGKAGRDTILDFTEGDEIDLSAIDAKKGDQAESEFKFIKKQEFQDKKGELRYKVKKSGDALVQGDVNGYGKADFSILVDGVSKLRHTDFEL